MEEKVNISSKLEVEQVKDGNSKTCCTFIMHNEDHTLGNALRYIIAKNPDVEFCGYSIPHPAENKINFRIQTRGAAVTEVLRKGLEDLHSVCQHVLTTFESAVEDYKHNTDQNVAS
uniref:DNA-directed RNA polymerases I and III subunit RPAC2 n=1 Tax=Phallusia mammillata TaxID=59560 RepID=A0A6F9DPW8_9ASCI|nr:DNA-directed RNA polymerase II subunit RPB11-a [Phallusia mammillata]